MSIDVVYGPHGMCFLVKPNRNMRNIFNKTWFGGILKAMTNAYGIERRYQHTNVQIDRSYMIYGKYGASCTGLTKPIIGY